MPRCLWIAFSVSLNLGAVLVGLVGCAADKSAELKPAELVEFKPSVTVRTVWSASVGRSVGQPLQPAVLDNAVYAASASGSLVRLAPDNGAVVWRIEVGHRISSGVASDGFIVVVATTLTHFEVPLARFWPGLLLIVLGGFLGLQFFRLAFPYERPGGEK